MCRRAADVPLQKFLSCIEEQPESFVTLAQTLIRKCFDEPNKTRILFAAMLFMLTKEAVQRSQKWQKWQQERQDSRQILQKKLIELREKLPDPNTPDLARVMPRRMPDMRWGVCYYPQRNAYKYTFIDDLPETLERRSI